MSKNKNRSCIKNPWLSKKDNILANNHYFYQLIDIAINRYQWEGLPEEIDPRFFEYQLNWMGYALFFKDEIANYFLVTQCSIGGRWDIYNIPKYRRAIASNGYQASRTDKDSIIVFNNYMRTSTTPTIQYYANKLMELERSIEINSAAQRTPYMLKAEESQRLSVKNAYAQVAVGEPVVYLDKSFAPDAIQVLNTNAPYVCDKLYDLKIKYWNEALSFLGVMNVNTEKKERLISDEVYVQNNDTDMNRLTGLSARERACKEINNMFGLNLSVKFRDSIADNYQKN